MRAKLSAIHEHGQHEPCVRLEAVNGYRWDYERAARVELVKILHEAEPETAMTDSIGIERLQGTGNVEGLGRANVFAGSVALAESLQAFCQIEGL